MRIIGGLLGVLILYVLYYDIFIEPKPIFDGGGYGPIMPFVAVYFAVVFVAYALGANKLLRKIAPQFAAKQNKDEMEVEIKNKNDM